MVRHNAPATFTAKMDAEAWLAAERRAIERSEWLPPQQRAAERSAKSIPFGKYAAEWVDGRALKPRTKSGYRDSLRLHILPTFDRLPLGSITPDLVRAWYAGLGTTHVTRNRHAYSLLHAICETAVRDGLVRSNPCNLPKAMSASRRRDPVILTVAEVDQLAEIIDPQRLRCVILLAAWCGLRWGEVSELRRKDVRSDAEILHVARGVTRRDGAYRVDTPKSGKSRIIVIPPHIRQDVRNHLALNVGEDDDSLLFPAARGGHMNERVFSREYFAAALEKVGRKGVVFHDFRHFAGTQTARVGNLVETMGRLGHSTPKASLIYQGIVSGRDRAIAEALSQLATATS